MTDFVTLGYIHGGILGKVLFNVAALAHHIIQDLRPFHQDRSLKSIAELDNVVRVDDCRWVLLVDIGGNDPTFQSLRHQILPSGRPGKDRRN